MIGKATHLAGRDKKTMRCGMTFPLDAIGEDRQREVIKIEPTSLEEIIVENLLSPRW